LKLTQARGQHFYNGDTTMEGPKVPSEARRSEAPERRGGRGLGRGAVAPPQCGDLDFRKINVESCISNVWRVTPVAKQSSAWNSGAKNFFSPWRGGIHPCPLWLRPWMDCY